MTKHYNKKKIREFIACPQFGDDHYGKWGGLRIDQRETIKDLCDIVDSADSVIKNQYKIIKEIENELKKYENDAEANRYAPIQECLDIINNSSWFDNKGE